jgi:hypothetical protein
MISEAEKRHLAELYAESADTSDPLHPDAEQRRKAFDSEVERLFAIVAPDDVRLPQFKSKAVQICVKYLHRDLPPDERRALDTTI